MKNEIIEKYASLRETADLNAKPRYITSEFDVSIFGAFNEESWVTNTKLYGSAKIDTDVLMNIFSMYYYCNRGLNTFSKKFIFVLVNKDGDSYLCRLNENNLDKYGRTCPFIEIIEVRTEDEFYNAIDTFKTSSILPKVFGITENSQSKTVDNKGLKVPYVKSEKHFVLKDFLYINMENSEIKSFGFNSFDVNNVQHSDRENYDESVKLIKKK